MKTTITVIEGEYLTLKDAQELVDGYVELVKLPHEYVMLINEDGHSKQLPLNRMASHIAGGLILGNVVVLTDRTAQEDWTWESKETA